VSVGSGVFGEDFGEARKKTRRGDMKQYLLLVDEVMMVRLGLVFREELRFLEVEGMGIGNGEQQFQMLVTPVRPVLSQPDVGGMADETHIPLSDLPSQEDKPLAAEYGSEGIVGMNRDKPSVE
jgi:hypothetical protein